MRFFVRTDTYDDGTVYYIGYVEITTKILFFKNIERLYAYNWSFITGYTYYKFGKSEMIFKTREECVLALTEAYLYYLKLHKPSPKRISSTVDEIIIEKPEL